MWKLEIEKKRKEIKRQKEREYSQNPQSREWLR